MIYGIGTDIIETERVKQQLKKISGLEEQIFTPFEIDYCHSKKFSEQHFAARLAAKESLFKALGTGWRYGMSYHEIEIKNDDLGKPHFHFSGKVKKHLDNNGIICAHLSLSHLKSYANAFVVLEFNQNLNKNK